MISISPDGAPLEDPRCIYASRDDSNYYNNVAQYLSKSEPRANDKRIRKGIVFQGGP